MTCSALVLLLLGVEALAQSPSPGAGTAAVPTARPDPAAVSAPAAPATNSAGSTAKSTDSAAEPAETSEPAGQAGAAPASADAVSGREAAGAKPSAPRADGEAEQSAVRRVGRHFSFVWDAEGPPEGTNDVQLWMTPRWGRLDGFTAVDLRAGVVRGLAHDWAAGFFIEAQPSSRGPNLDPDLRANVFLRLQNRGTLGDFLSYGSQLELGGGPRGFALGLLVAAETQIRSVRVGLNLDGYTETDWDARGGGTFSRAWARQTLGVSYALGNGVSVAVELQNRLAWTQVSVWAGDALLLGPSLAYRGEHVWLTVALLPQVAALKPVSRRGVGDPLELTENERFTLRLSMGMLAQ